MPIVVQLEADAGGLVVVKRADRQDAAALEREGARLVACAHPGVVRVLASGQVAHAWELRLAHGGVPLDGDRPVSPGAAARIAASVAATLADLHDRGLVHGRLHARRVLVGSSGEVRLCGFGPAATRPDGRPAHVEDDVGALGRLVLDLLDSAPPSRRRPPIDGALRSIAERAQAEPASRRPSARRLADELERVQATRGRAASPAVRWGLAVAVGVAGIVAVRWPDRTGPRPPSMASDTTTATATPPIHPACVATEGRPVGPPACPTSVVVAAGAATVDGVRYALGHEGDRIVVGDWDCAGAVSAALLRPSTGEVVVFTPFAPDRAVSVAVAERVVGATELSPAVGPDGCAEIGVLDRSGARTAIGEDAPA